MNLEGELGRNRGSTSLRGRFARTASLPYHRPAWLSSISWGVALLLLGVSAYLAWQWSASTAFTVNVEVDGRQQAVRSHRSDVGALLSDLGVRIRPEDRVIPHLDAPLTDDLVVRIQRALPYLVSADGALRHGNLLAETPAEYLAAAGIRLQTGDEVWHGAHQVEPESTLAGPPAARSAGAVWGWQRPSTQPVRLTVRRAVPITVDDGSVPFTIFTTAPTIGEALLREEITLYLGDKVAPSLGSRVQPGLRVFIDRSKPLVVTADGRTVQTRTRGKTVGDALVDLGIYVTGSDRVTPALSDPLTDHMQVKLVRVNESVLVKRTAIPYESISAPDDNLEIDHKKLAQAGHDGEFRERFKIVQEDGAEVSHEMIDSWVAAAPVTRIEAYGRKLVSRELDTPAGTVSYWRKVRMYATSYSPARAGTPKSAPWYGRTRIGLPLKKGLVAVDPSVIPLRSKVYVPGYGIALAADTGGGVRGRMIDLGFEDHDYESWHRWIDVYLLDPPPARGKFPWVLPKYPQGRFPGY